VDTDPLEVIVVEDHLTVRRGIELLLRAEGFRIAGTASTVDEARALLARRRHDVALIDVHLGDESAVGLVEEMLRRDPDAAIVLNTGYTEPRSGLSDAVRAGARGFVLKSSPPSRLIDALRSVAAGGHYVDPDLAAALSEDAELSHLSNLSPREREVLGLLAEGLTGQAIAECLFLSPETVRTHVRNATTKLGAKTRVQAVAMVIRTRGIA
jgi:DNA-binding NarL/FixJ family response regulator